MMKTFRFCGMMLMAMVMAFSMTACGGDDDDNNSSSTNNAKATTANIANTKWYQEKTIDGKVSYTTFIYDNLGPVQVGSLYEDKGQWYKFSAHQYLYKVEGNRYTWGSVLKESDATSPDSWVQSGLYNIQGDVLTINWDSGETGVMILKSFTEDILKIYDSATAL